ncbi:MAG: alanine--tRNA ligase-related protein, partial [Pseudomonadota bacterium]
MTDCLFRDDAYLQRCSATVVGHSEQGGVILDRTVFYATGGGQPGDAGTVAWVGGEMAVATAVKDPAGIAHVPAEEATLPPVGAE